MPMNKVSCVNCGVTIIRSPSSTATVCGYCLKEGAAITPEMPGDVLTKALTMKGYREMQKCKCKTHRYQMNRWGVAGCRANIETIVDWLEEAAKQSSATGKALYIPGLRGLGRAYLRGLVTEAIDSAVATAE